MPRRSVKGYGSKAFNDASNLTPCTAQYDENDEFDFNCAELNGYKKNPGAVQWHTLNLLYPVDSVEPQDFYKRLTPRHFAQAFYSNIQFTGDPSKANPSRTPVGDDRSKRSKTQQVATSILKTSARLAQADLKAKFGLDVFYPTSTYPTATDDHLRNIRKIDHPADGSLIPFLCRWCFLRGKCTLCAVGILYVVASDIEPTQEAAHVLANLGDDTTIDTETSDGSEKVGCLQITLLFPHDAHCEANSTSMDGIPSVLTSPKQIYDEQKMATVPVEYNSVVGDTFNSQIALLASYYKDPDSAFELGFCEDGKLINFDNPHQNIDHDDRMYYPLPAPLKGEDVDDEPSPEKKLFVSNLNLEFMAPFLARFFFHSCVQLGLERELCPFVLDWSILPRQGGGAPSAALNAQHQIKWKRNPEWHLFFSEPSIILGGAKIDAWETSAGQRVTHQVGHRDHALLHDKLASLQSTDTGIDPFTRLSVAARQRLRRKRTLDNSEQTTDPPSDAPVRTLPGAVTMPLMESRKMWFEHPANCYEIMPGKLHFFSGDKLHGGWTYPLSQCMDNREGSRHGRLWRPTYHCHMDSTFIPRQSGIIDTSFADSRFSFVDPYHLRDFVNPAIVKDGLARKMKDVNESADLLVKQPNEPYHYRGNFGVLERAQLLLVRHATTDAEELTAAMGGNPGKTQAQCSLKLAAHYLNESSKAGVQMSSAETSALKKAGKYLLGVFTELDSLPSPADNDDSD